MSHHVAITLVPFPLEPVNSGPSTNEPMNVEEEEEEDFQEIDTESFEPVETD